MGVFEYRTIAGPAESLFKEKGSKFLGFAFPVADESEIKNRLEQLRKRYFDASHHCYAWVLGADRKLSRASDDGEPAHSAGDPIMGQIRSRNLTNVLVVIVRYFGGTKLGVGGLVAAYKTAADLTLAQAKLIDVDVTTKLGLYFPYTTNAEVMRLVKDFDLKILTQEYGTACYIEVSVAMRDHAKLIEKLELLQAMGSGVRVRDSK